MNKAKILTLIGLLALLSLGLSGGALAGEAALPAAQTTLPPLAELVFSAQAVEWQPLVENGGFTLVVAAPDGSLFQRSFAAGVNPHYSLAGRPDGLYNYELRLTPLLEAETLALLDEARLSPDREQIVAQLVSEGKLSPVAPQTGSFRLQDGQAFAPSAQEEESASAEAPAAPSGPTAPQAPDDVLHYDDVIITGSLCVGFDCIDGESFGYNTIKLKENNLQIGFEDTSIGTYPTNDWRIQVNDTTSGGANYFAILDVDGNKYPFRVEAGARDHSLYVADNGMVGFRTSTPAEDLHAVWGDTPTLRLDQQNWWGWGTQVWDVSGNEANFFIRDVTNSNKLPFRIQPNTPSDTLTMRSSGYVGIGTWSPEKNLEIQTTGADASLRLQRTNGETWDLTAGASDSGLRMENGGNSILTVKSNGLVEVGGYGGNDASLRLLKTGGATWDLAAGASDLHIENSGNSILILKPDGMVEMGGYGGNDARLRLQKAGGGAWDLAAGTSNLRIVNGGNSILTVKPNGLVEVRGYLVEQSDREAKAGFAAVDNAQVLERLAQLPISSWNYKSEGTDVRHIGPVAQDFHAAFGLGADDKHIAALDANGVALAAIQALDAQVKEKDVQIGELQAQVDDLHSRLEALERSEVEPPAALWSHLAPLVFGLLGLWIGARLAGRLGLKKQPGERFANR